MSMVGLRGMSLPDTPLFIVAEATLDDWMRNVRSTGGRDQLRKAKSRYFYFVRQTDTLAGSAS